MLFCCCTVTSTATAYNLLRTLLLIEWNYGITAGLYGYLTNTNKLKLLGSHVVSKEYTVATIMRNCHVAMYGCETSHYFDIEMEDNFLELYMRM